MTPTIILLSIGLWLLATIRVYKNKLVWYVYVEFCNNNTTAAAHVNKTSNFFLFRSHRRRHLGGKRWLERRSRRRHRHCHDSKSTDRHGLFFFSKLPSRKTQPGFLQAII